MIKINNTFRKFIRIIIAATILSVAVLPFTASAKAAVKKPIGTLSAKIDVASSNGSWSWNAETLTLSLKNCKIKTKGLYGCVVPDGTKVIIKGKNVISSDRVSLWCKGNMTIKGKGTLKLKSNQDTALTTDETLRIKGGKIYAYTKSKYASPVVIDKALKIRKGVLSVYNHQSASGIEVAKNIRVYKKGKLRSESYTDNAVEIFAGKAIYLYGGVIKGNASGKTSYGVWSDGEIYVTGGKLRGFSNNNSDGIGCVAKKTFKITGGNVKAKGNLTAIAAWNRVISTYNRERYKVNPSLIISSKMKISSGATVKNTWVSQRYHGVGAKTDDYICERFCVLGTNYFSYSYDNFRFTNTLREAIISV